MPTQPSTTIGTVPGNVQNATSGSGKGTAAPVPPSTPPVPPSTPLAYGGGANESLALQQFLAQMNARQNSYWNNPAAPAVPVTPPVVTPPPDTGDETPPPVVEPFGPEPFGKPKKENNPKYKIPFPNIQPGQTLSDYMLDVNQYMAEPEVVPAEKKRRRNWRSV